MALAAATRENAELKRFLINPLMADSAKAEVLSDILARAKAHKDAVGMVEFLARKKRLNVLSDVAENLRDRAAAHDGVLYVECTSAQPLTEKAVKEIAANLKKATGKEVEVAAKVDSSLLGGLTLRMGSLMLDHSVAGKLKQLRSSLNAPSLA